MAWRKAADSVVQAFRQRIRVVVTGRLREDVHETASGAHRTTIEPEVEDVGVSLRLASVIITRVLLESAEAVADAAPGPSRNGTRDLPPAAVFANVFVVRVYR